MRDYNIVVRSYKRSETICQNTLGFLSKQECGLLSRTTLLVANQEEYDLYEKSLLENSLYVNEIIITGPGGANSNNIGFSKFPENWPLFMMDDDIKEMHEFTDINDQKSKRPIRNLEKYILFGFDACEKYGAGGFSFNYSNPYFKKGKPFAKIGAYRITGTLYGAFNVPELQSPVSHEDDNYRSAKLLDKYSRNMIFDWIEMKLGTFGKNPGGMQSSNDRTDTLAQCNKILSYPEVQKYFDPEPVYEEKNGVYTCKPIHRTKLKKKSYFKDDVLVQQYFSQLEDQEPSLLSLL